MSTVTVCSRDEPNATEEQVCDHAPRYSPGVGEEDTFNAGNVSRTRSQVFVKLLSARITLITPICR